MPTKGVVILFESLFKQFKRENNSIVTLQDKKYRFIYRLFSIIGFLIGIPIHAKSMAQGHFGFITRPGLFPNDASMPAILEDYNR